MCPPLRPPFPHPPLPSPCFSTTPALPLSAAFPTAVRRKALAFGSFAHGVSLPGADLDVVVSGIMTPISRGGGEYLLVPQSCCSLCGSRDAILRAAASLVCRSLFTPLGCPLACMASGWAGGTR